MKSSGMPVHSAVPSLQFSMTHSSHAIGSGPRQGIRQLSDEHVQVPAQQLAQSCRPETTTLSRVKRNQEAKS